MRRLLFRDSKCIIQLRGYSGARIKNNVKDKKPPGFWLSSNNQRDYMNELALKLNLSHWEDWYSVICI